MAVLDGGRPGSSATRSRMRWVLQVGLSCDGSIDVLIEPFSPAEHGPLSVRPYRAASRGPSHRARSSSAPGSEAAIAAMPVVGSIDPGWMDSGCEGRDLCCRAEHGSDASLARPGSEHLHRDLPLPLRSSLSARRTSPWHCTAWRRIGLQRDVIDPRVSIPPRTLSGGGRHRASVARGSVGTDHPDAYSYVVILSHDSSSTCRLAWALRSEARYIGMMGSRHTYARRQARLLEQGFTESDLQRIRAPIGLDSAAARRRRLRSPFSPRWWPCGTGATGNRFARGRHRFMTSSGTAFLSGSFLRRRLHRMRRPSSCCRWATDACCSGADAAVDRVSTGGRGARLPGAGIRNALQLRTSIAFG